MFDKFKEKLETIAKEQNVKEITPIIKIDSQITAKDINTKVIEELKRLEPFGEKNKEPVFVYKNLKIDSIRALSEGKHLKLVLKDESRLIDAIRI